jgi:hypothetical protein
LPSHSFRSLNSTPIQEEAKDVLLEIRTGLTDFSRDDLPPPPRKDTLDSSNAKRKKKVTFDDSVEKNKPLLNVSDFSPHNPLDI